LSPPIDFSPGGDEGRTWLDTDRHSRTRRWRGCCRRRARAGGGGTRDWHRRGTLERWREEAQSRPARGRAWTAAARLEAVITTAAMNEAEKSAWCRKHGVYSRRAGQVARQLHHGAGRRPRTCAPARRPRGRPQAHQGARARSAAQGPGAGGDGGAAGAVKKSRGDLQQGRGRMIGLEDRQALARDIETAHGGGARLHRLARSRASTCAPCSAGRPRTASQRAMAGRRRCGRCPQPCIEPAGARSAAGRGQ
jgi:hypothetical protein